MDQRISAVFNRRDSIYSKRCRGLCDFSFHASAVLQQRTYAAHLQLNLPLADVSSRRRSEDTRTALIDWGGRRPIDVNDGINIFTANKAAPRVHHVRTPQFLQLDGYHKSFATRTTHRVYFPIPQISTIACRVPSCGLIISSMPLRSEALLKNVATFAS